MTRYPSVLRHVVPLACALLMLLIDAWRFLCLSIRPSPALAAENLFLRKQLALYQERHVKAQRATNATRATLVWLARWFDWAMRLDHCPASDLDPVASPGVSAILVLNISSRTSTDSSRTAGTDPSNRA